MSRSTVYPHLSVDEGGQARIGQTRYKVMHLAVEHYQYGWSSEELLRQHPDLRPEEVYAALTYFYDHHDAMVAEIKSTRTAIEADRSSPPFTRDELVKRRAAGAN